MFVSSRSVGDRIFSLGDGAVKWCGGGADDFWNGLMLCGDYGLDCIVGNIVESVKPKIAVLFKILLSFVALLLVVFGSHDCGIVFSSHW